MKVHFRAAKHPLLNADREKEMFDFIAFLRLTAEEMLCFVFDHREELQDKWRDSSLKKSFERAFKGGVTPEEAKKKWLDSERLFRSYDQNWEAEPSIMASRSFDAFSLDGKLENQNNVKLWERRKEHGVGTWRFMGGKGVGPDADETKWEGDSYIPKNSIIMMRMRFSFFCSSVGYGVSLRFSPDIAVLHKASSSSVQADPDL